jgi:hypothetical protein
MKFFSLGLMLVMCTSALRAEDLAIGLSHHSRTPKRVWIRRATLAAGCAASLALDTWSTHRMLQAGAIETNPLLANSQGGTNWARTIGLKAGVCGVSALMEETNTFHAWRSPNADWTWTGINAATTAAYTWASIHNFSLANPLSK